MAELNLTENALQYLRDSWLFNWVSTSVGDIVDRGCRRWNKRIVRRWTILSIGIRDWASV
jgi:hypothetical protein